STLCSGRLSNMSLACLLASSERLGFVPVFEGPIRVPSSHDVRVGPFLGFRGPADVLVHFKPGFPPRVSPRAGSGPGGGDSSAGPDP
ncbi:MAG: hypothetical protein SGPRY_011212, partial [Prymnesium sp.]